MKKSACFLILLILLLFHADWAAAGAKNGLLLWYSAVVPALFPFMILSGLIVAGGGIRLLMRPFSWVLGPLLGLSPDGCYVLISGFLCGYPMGAKTAADFLTGGRIGKSEANFLLAAANHPSPMFLLGFAYPLFQGQTALWKLLLAVYGPTVMIAALGKRIYRLNGGAESAFRKDQPASLKSTETSADELILSSAEVLVKIGGFLMLFSIGIVFLKESTFLPGPLQVFAAAFLEMTTGIKEAAVLLPYPYSAILGCASLGFGGLSGIFQTRAVIEKAGLSIRPYILWKLFHGSLSAAIFFLVS